MHLRGSPRLSIFLFLLVGLVSFQVYQVWEEGLPEMPSPMQESPRMKAPKERKTSVRTLRRSTSNIVQKNLFDPARGRDSGKVTEPTQESSQGAEEYVLLGTLITSGGRKALIRILPASRGTAVRGRRARTNARTNGTTRQGGEVRRIALGEPLGEFQLAEIQPHKVILKKGSEQVELVLDFMARPEQIEAPKSKPAVTKKKASPSRRQIPRSRNRRKRDS